jgi:hypothetical protein
MQCIAVGFGVAILLLLTMGVAVAQNPAAPVPAPGAAMSVPAGYSLHSGVDIGGRIADTTGSGAMYDTLVNMQSGPRVLGQTFEMRALPGNKHPLFDNLTAFSSGFGGDPYNFSKMDVSKGKYYEFSARFRRDRRYFDYDLLANPDIPSGYSIPIGPNTAPTGYYAWPQLMDSPYMFNTVRRMTDTNLTLLPVSKVTFRFAYSKNLTEGPSLTPSGNSVAGSEVLLEEFQRNNTDDYTAAMDWKPIQGTTVTYEEQIDHYKGDSYFIMDPAYFTVQESDGTKVALLANYQNYYPYGYSSSTGAFDPTGSYTPTTSHGKAINSVTAGVCGVPTITNGRPPGNTTSSMINPSTILYANPAGGLPIIDPACNVISSYVRYQPTREIFPTEIIRFQSTSIKNISMNGNVRYTSASMNLPNYYENFQGLYSKAPSASVSTSGVVTVTPGVADRELAYTAFANAKREVVAVDYGIVWKATKIVSLADQVSFSNVHQPGTAEFTSGTTESQSSVNGLDTINNITGLTSTTVTSGSAPFEGSPAIGAASFGYFGQRFVINNATVSWDATPRSTFSLTYRYRNHVFTEGEDIFTPVAGVGSVACPSTNPQAYCGTVSINENGGIFNAALRPTNNWDLNGTVELLYDDNVITPVAPRQTQHYRVHTIYKPKPWATISGAYNDLERHNNTNNNLGTALPSYVGPLDHVDHSRVVSLGAALYPNEHYGLDLNYAYSDVYTSTNICFQGMATLMPGSTVVPGAATPTGTLCSAIASAHGSTTVLFGPVQDFMDAPTQYGSATVILSPNPKWHYDIGYRISSVNGSRFFADALDVNGSLVSTYQSPFVKATYTMHPGFIWKAEYNFYGYGEGGPSGAQYCNKNPSLSSGAAGSSVPVVLCSSVANTAMSPATPVYGFTAPRNFHANNAVLGVHYEF